MNNHKICGTCGSENIRRIHDVMNVGYCEDCDAVVELETVDEEE